MTNGPEPSPAIKPSKTTTGSDRPARVFAVTLTLLLAFAAVGDQASAQVILDGTIRPANEGFVPNFALPGQPARYVADESIGGLSANGRNLFHSFRSLSIGVDESLTFTGSSSIENVIARVTGGGESVIQGLLRSEVGTADLFLFNPAGIRFVGGSQTNLIELPGSFYSSTADFLSFDNATDFPSGGSSDVTIHTGAPAAWGFSGSSQASITVDETLPLAVSDGNVLSLIASDVRVTNAAEIQANGGELQLAAVGDYDGTIALALETVDVNDLGGSNLGEILIENFSTLRAGSGFDGISDPTGRLVIRGGRLTVANRSTLTAGGNATEGIDAIDIAVSGAIDVSGRSTVFALNPGQDGLGLTRLQADELRLTDRGSQLASIGRSGASGGGLEIDARLVILENEGRIFTDADDGPEGGDITVRADSLTLDGFSSIETRTRGDANSGDIRLQLASQDIALDLRNGSRIGSVTTGLGAAGNVTVEGSGGASAGRLLLSGTDDPNTADFKGSSIFTLSGTRFNDSESFGAAGSIELHADSVELVGGSAILAESFGTGASTGRAGAITIDATQLISLTGTADGTPAISARTVDGPGAGVGLGPSGEDLPGINLRTNLLSVQNGAGISTSTLGRGRGATIRIDANDVRIGGLDDAGNRAAILSEGIPSKTDTFLLGEGDTGSIEIVADRFRLDRGGLLSIQNERSGRGGTLSIDARESITVSGGIVQSNAFISATGPAGDLFLNAPRIVIDQGGLITAGSTSTRPERSASAGTIRVDAHDFLHLEDASITTQSEETAGGEIRIRAGDEIVLRNSLIETRVAGDVSAGSAGNVLLVAPTILLDPESSVVASATQGDGGDITVVAEALLALGSMPFDASSDLGINGTITVTSPETDLASALSRLPSVFLQNDALLPAHCAARSPEQGSFVVRRSEGRPASSAQTIVPLLPLPEPADRQDANQATGAALRPSLMGGLDRDCARLDTPSSPWRFPAESP